MIQAGGVAVKGLQTSTPTKRVVHPTPIVNEYQFVPYIDSECNRQLRQARIQEYIDTCNGVAGRVLRKLSKDQLRLCELPQQNFEVHDEKLQAFLEYNDGNHGLLKVLDLVEGEAEKSASLLDGFTQSLVNTHKEKLETDIITTALFGEDPLRHLLDVVVENTSLKSLQVLEIAAPGTHCILAPRVSSLSVMSNMLLKIDYTIAQHPMDNLLLEIVPKNVKIVKWDPTSDSNKQLPEANLILACFSPWSSYNPDILADKVSELCKEQGFLLVFQRTNVTLAERLIANVADHTFTVHSIEGMERLFQSHGFQLVGQKSNNFSALLLLRKTVVTVETAEPLLLKVSNAKYDWVDVLKSKALDVEQRPPGHNLWLLAKDCGMSGVVGLTNCLRLETGGSHISPSNPTYSDIITKDLVMNIYRDGQWGSFRHTSPLKCGTPKIPTEFACLGMETTGDLSSLQWYTSPLGYAVPSISTNKAICTVFYAALNFRDVMLTTGKLSPDALPGDLATSEFLLGMEFAGIDPPTGAESWDLCQCRDWRRLWLRTLLSCGKYQKRGAFSKQPPYRWRMPQPTMPSLCMGTCVLESLCSFIPEVEESDKRPFPSRSPWDAPYSPPSV
ncbi:hypothetical protein MTO96_030554 [Rhipicephalus appendiculatus]